MMRFARFVSEGRENPRVMMIFGSFEMPPEVPSQQTAAQPADTDAEARIDLLGRSEEELRVWVTERGEPAFRGSQLFHALYAERRSDFASMTNLPAAFRARLEHEA